MHFFRLAYRSVVGAVIAFAMLGVLAGPAFAHDPIFISADQTTPDTGPYMPDGSISWALYGSVLFEGDTRGFEFDLRDGEELVVSLLIPNLEPELSLSDPELPVLDLEMPDGSMRQIVPEIREVFDEPFSNTSYVTLAEIREPGMEGRYRGIVTGTAPSRFSVAIGINEIFFTETERSGDDRPTNFMEISAPLGRWYSTPPGGEPATDTLDEGEAQIDMELIEEAMGSDEDEASEEETASVAEDTSTADEEATVADAEPANDNGDTTENADEVAGIQVDTEDGSNVTWIAPVAIGVLALLGAGAYFARSR